MKKRDIYKLGLIILLLPLVIGACNRVSTPTTTNTTESFFTQLATDPEKYNGQTVTFTGFIFYGFEVSVVCEYLEPWDTLAGVYRAGGIKIWLSGALPEGIEAQLHLQTNDPTGYPAHYGKVEITGTIEYGAKYGHMDAYKYKINVTDAKVLEWSERAGY